MMKHARAVALCLALLCAGNAVAMAPGYLSDEELAGFPIIVVAQWERAGFEAHHEYEKREDFGTVLVTAETYTKLRIVRVVKGPELKAGQHDLMAGMGISWRKDGTRLSSGTSTDLLGDVQDITKPSLWFLKRARSWDKKRPNEYVWVHNYRQIQPLELEEYFLALGSDRPSTEVPRLLTPEKPAVALRVLRHISGGIWPWPYEPDGFEMRYSTPSGRGRILRKEAKRAWGVVSSEAEEIRPYAVSVYAELEGHKCLADMRKLLADKNPSVRAIAAGILVRHRDILSLPKLQAAIRGVDEGRLTGRLVGELSSWGDERLVPSLITCLQNGQFCYRDEDLDWGWDEDEGEDEPYIVALKARKALREITGHWFPLDVGKSMDAWQQAVKVTGKAKRRALLEQLIPGREFPLMAELIGKPTYKGVEPEGVPGGRAAMQIGEPDAGAVEREVFATVRIRNTTREPLMIAKQPSDVSLSWPAGCSSYGEGFAREELKKDDFILLKPARSLELAVKLNQSFLTADPSTRRLQLSYYSNGSSIGLIAWIGTLRVGRGPQWEENRQTRKVERKWPNGNLRETGTTVNGHRLGKWNYFNEQGDRVKIVYYGEGRGTATCNPEHPANKGAGRRPQEKQKPRKAIDGDRK